MDYACSSWNALGQNTEVGSHSLLQGIFPTQGSNAGLPHWRRALYQLSHQGRPPPILYIPVLLLNTFPNKSVNSLTSWFVLCIFVSPIPRTYLAYLAQVIRCSVTQSCLTLFDPMDCSTPCLPAPHCLLKFAQVHVHCISDAILTQKIFVKLHCRVWSKEWRKGDE